MTAGDDDAATRPSGVAVGSETGGAPQPKLKHSRVSHEGIRRVVHVGGRRRRRYCVVLMRRNHTRRVESFGLFGSLCEIVPDRRPVPTANPFPKHFVRLGAKLGTNIRRLVGLAAADLVRIAYMGRTLPSHLHPHLDPHLHSHARPYPNQLLALKTLPVSSSYTASIQHQHAPPSPSPRRPPRCCLLRNMCHGCRCHGPEPEQLY